MLFKFDLPKDRMDDVVFNYVQSNYLTSKIYYIINTKYRTSVKLSKWLKEMDLSEIDNILSEIPSTTDYDEQVVHCLRWVRTNITYIGDPAQWGMLDRWQTVDETLQLRTGDCFAGYEEIYTKEGIKQIRDIKIGDSILSYNFITKDYEYKKIINHWSKGYLPVVRVHFRNGQHIDVTKDHPMWHKIKSGNYEKKYLSEIHLDSYIDRKVPIAKKIPYRIDIPKYNKELYKVIGHFLAEGWVDKSGKVGSSGAELIEFINPILTKYNIPYTKGMNGNGVNTINFLKSEFKEYLKTLKTSSFDIHLPEDFFHLPKECTEELLYGMWLGDGTKNIGKNQYNKEWVYSTSSEQLASDIQRLFLQQGKSLHIWKQEKHKGIGTKPIYRLTYNPKSNFMKEYGYKDISEVSIKYTETLDETEMYDLTVEDTHTVILKNGIITHQCEDGAFLLYWLCRKKGVPSNRLLLMAGDVTGGGHCWLAYRPIQYPLNYIFLDWCYWYDNDMIPNRTFYYLRDGNLIEAYDKNNDSYIDLYIDMWFAFSEDNSYLKLIYKPIGF